MKEHPITPPAELVQKLADGPGTWLEKISKAYCAGADQELAAICEWLETGPYGFSIAATIPSMTKRLRTARRPKPPSLKEQALCHLESFAGSIETLGMDSDLIRRALESLPS